MDTTEKRILLAGGKEVGQIPVHLSYQIIKHFSAGLYTSPYKAIEELVANSYDAWAPHVHVILPDNVSSSDATIWVIDDGESMDVSGFKELWRIGESNKRNAKRNSNERPPIGKFGIGKLATYVLAEKLTYVCKRGGKYRAITMDFSKLEEDPSRKDLLLKVRELTVAETKQALSAVLGSGGGNSDSVRLFGTDAAKTWTVAAMSNLTPMAKKLTAGRLRYILSTALPINPQFNLYYNGTKLEPRKINQPTIAEWVVGQNDKTAESLAFESVNVGKGKRGLKIPQLGLIWGEAQIFEDVLSEGKSEDWGRSHGFFVIVRGRLINLHDELFGIEALSHGAFSRFRLVIHADGLDEYLRSTRETVSADEEGVVNLRGYLKAKFNEARAKYNTWLVDQEAEQSLSRRVSRTPRSFSRQPLVRAIRKVLDGKLGDLFLTRVPHGLSESQKTALLDSLEKSLESDEFFKEVRFEPIGVEQGIAVFDTEERCFKVNILHPFFANYADHSRAHEAFQLLAVAEVLTEAYLLEEDLSEDQVRNILVRRDRFLRALVFSTQLAAPLVAQLLRDNRADPKGLEKAVGEGLRSLGFEVSPKGKSGEPDGLALARMGVRDESDGKDETYTVSYEAKSTTRDRVSAKDINAATVQQHMAENKADFALVVAPAFEGDGAPDMNVSKQAKKAGITLITLEDFSRLILAASTRPLGFQRLRDEFFRKCRGPQDAKKLVDKLLDEKASETPLPEILEAIWEMQRDSPDPPKFAAVRERLALRQREFKTIRAKEVQNWMDSVGRFCGDLIWISGDQVSLNAPPDRILEVIRVNTGHLPDTIRRGSIYASLLGTKRNGQAKMATKRKKRRK